MRGPLSTQAQTTTTTTTDTTVLGASGVTWHRQASTSTRRHSVYYCGSQCYRTALNRCRADICAARGAFRSGHTSASDSATVGCVWLTNRDGSEFSSDDLPCDVANRGEGRGSVIHGKHICAVSSAMVARSSSLRPPACPVRSYYADISVARHGSRLHDAFRNLLPRCHSASVAGQTSIIDTQSQHDVEPAMGPSFPYQSGWIGVIGCHPDPLFRAGEPRDCRRDDLNW